MVALAAASAQAQQIFPVTPTSGSTMTGLQVRGMSADGEVVVGWGNIGGVSRAFRWTRPGEFRELAPYPGDFASYAEAAGGGFVVGSSSSGGRDRAVRWTPHGEIEDLGEVPPGVNYASASATTIDGSVVAGKTGESFALDAFWWTPADGMHVLIPTFYMWQSIAAISADGRALVGGGAHDPAGMPGGQEWGQAILWSDVGAGPQYLPRIAGCTMCWGAAVSGDGRLVVGGCRSCSGANVGFRWSQAMGLVALPAAAGFVSHRPSGVTRDGRVIVGTASMASGGSRAFIWTEPFGTLDLNYYLPMQGISLQGWLLQSAVQMSANGRVIAGNGVYEGVSRPFVVYLDGGPCYANCDDSTAGPVLNVADFTCYLQRYAAGDLYANCDLSSAPPVLNAADFTCFLQRYAAGCP